MKAFELQSVRTVMLMSVSYHNFAIADTNDERSILKITAGIEVRN